LSILYLVLTHRLPEEVALHLAALGRALPGRRFAVCYGGTEADFERLDVPAKAFVADPSLRGPMGEQSYVELLRIAYESFVAPDPEVELVHLIEHDHAIVDERYERELLRVLAATGADFLGGICVDRTYTNWWHTVALLDDEEWWSFLREISVRDEDELRVFGGIADAVTFRRAALEAFATLSRHLHRYCEVYVPTVLHHLGFTLGDASAISTVFDWLRWSPPFDSDELAALPDEVLAVHPVKDYALLDLVCGRALTPRPA
jgi:hypothetical protein